MKFKHNIEVQSGISDNNDLTGDSGQILSSTGSGVEWIDQNAITSASDFVFFDVKNETGSTILKGKGVMAVGTDGNSGHILIDEMVADGTVESKYFLGVLEENIANGGFARVISFGQLDQFNTNGQNGETWANGQILWCDPANPGDFTTVEPDGPNVKIAAAFILNKATNGKIQVRVQANEGIHDLHDTKITSQVDGDVLVWDNTTGVWFNDSTLNVDYTNGRVGINNDNPSYPLDFPTNQSGAAIRIGDDNVDSYIMFSRPRGYVGFDSDGYAVLQGGPTKGVRLNVNSDTFGNGTALQISDNGNVGIGTTSPNAKLDVREDTTYGIYGPSNAQLNLVNTDTEGTSGFLMLSAYYNNTNNTYYHAGGIGGGKETATGNQEWGGYLSFFTTSDGTAGAASGMFEHMRITADGNVGIGTTSPGYKLDVAGNARFTSEINMEEDHYINLRFEIPDSINPEQYILLCRYAGGNDVNGTITMDRTSGLRHACSVDIIVSAGSSALPVAGLRAIGVSGNGNPKYNLVTCYLSGVQYVALKIENPDTYYESTGAYFTGRIKSTGVKLVPKLASELTSIADYELNTLHTFSGDSYFRDGNVGIGTDSPGARLDILGPNSSTGTIKWQNPGRRAGYLYSDGGGIAIYDTALSQAGIYMMSNTRMDFRVNGSERMRITSGGTLLLGDTNIPSESVWKGTAVFGQTGTDKVIVGHLESSTDGAVIGGHNAALDGWAPLNIDGTELRFNVQQSRKMTMDSDGNLGIGTTSPESPLHIDGGSSSEVLKVEADTSPYIRWTQNGTNVGFLQFSGASAYLSNMSNGNFFFRTNNSDKMVITSTGNVGIGTTSPGQKLHVANNNFCISRVEAVGYNSIDIIASGGYSIISANDNSPLFFDTGGNTRVVIDSTGNVGIGTTSPGSKLEVTGDTANALLTLKSESGGSNDAFMRFYEESGGNSYSVGLDSSDAKFKIAYATDNDSLTTGTKLVMDTLGNVGIGTTSPGQKLHVNGNMTANNYYLYNNTTRGMSAFLGDPRLMCSSSVRVTDSTSAFNYKPILASAFTVSSDYRLKSNIVPLDNAISRLNQLEVHRFNWNDRLDEPKVDGFIAHEVSSVIPEAVLGEKDAVYEDGTPDYQGIDQAKIVPLLTAALQEAIQKIEQLETRIQALENNN